MKRNISLLLAILLILTLAACSGSKNPYAESQVGDTVQVGGYDWRVLAVEDGRLLVLSEKVLEKRAYHPDGGKISWEESDIRAYLNSEFYEGVFSEEEKSLITDSALENKSNSQYGTGAGNDTTDKVFCLSIKEVEHYMESADERIAEDLESGEPSLWWLRTPGRDKEYAANVGVTGYIDFHGILVVEAGDNESSGLSNSRSDYASAVDGGVRPAMWLSCG